jgi:hypothetical protein
MDLKYIDVNKSKLAVAGQTDVNQNSLCENHYANHTPVIFLLERPPFAVAYFNGPWLPMSCTNEFTEYTFGLDYPMQVLELPKRRDGLVAAMMKLRNSQQQLSLFSPNGRAELESMLDSLVNQQKEGRRLYKSWVQKIGEKERELSVPQKPLDSLLNNYAKDIIMLAPCHTQCHGGEKGWSVMQSLATHVPLGTVLSFDISNAFKNVAIQYVFDFYYRTLEGKPINNKTRIDVAGFLTTLSTVYYKDIDDFGLPQGSSISIALFNRLFYPIDELINKIATGRNLRYTRWVDDLLISAEEPNRRREALLTAVSVVREDFPINLGKVFLQQDVPEYYLLGHKIIGNMIIKVDKEEAKNRGKPLGSDAFLNTREIEAAVWDSDPPDFDDFTDGEL